MPKEVAKVNVRRLKTDCCGMVEGRVYPATVEGPYVRCKLPDGTWTSSHWGLNEGWFEVTLNLEPPGEIGMCDDCLRQGDGGQKPVKRIEEDNIYFCRPHWEEYEKACEEAGYKVSKFLEIV
jgi:hypothetical protein